MFKSQRREAPKSGAQRRNPRRDDGLSGDPPRSCEIMEAIMQDGSITNEAKRQVYAILKAKLKVALRQEFYLEALLLECSIL